MVKPEWGIKRQCPSCGARFYDMKRNPVSCPSCDANVPIEPLVKQRKPAAAKEAPAAVKAKAPVDPDAIDDDSLDDVIDDVDDIDDDDDDDDDALIEDASDLEEDDDIPVIVDHIDDELNTEG